MQKRYALSIVIDNTTNKIIDRFYTFEEAKYTAITELYGEYWEILEWDNVNHYYEIVESNI